MRRIMIAMLAWCSLLLVLPAQAQSGTWTLEFFDDVNIASAPVLTLSTNNLVFDWGQGAPGQNVPADNFSGRFTGNLYFDGGTYQINMTADDEFVLFVNGSQVLSTWNTGQVGQTLSASVYMRPGYNTVQVLYREFGGAAYLRTQFIGVATNQPGYTQPGYGGYYPPAFLPDSQPSQPTRPINENQTGTIRTRYGDYSSCRDNNFHQSKCFQSDGQWDSPNLGSIQGEPQIRTWQTCTAGSTSSFSWGQGRCSKTGAGYFPA